MCNRMKKGNDFVDMREALEITGFSQDKLFKLIKEEKITVWKVAGELRFHRRDIEKLLNTKENEETHEHDFVPYRCFV